MIVTTTAPEEGVVFNGAFPQVLASLLVPQSEHEGVLLKIIIHRLYLYLRFCNHLSFSPVLFVMYVREAVKNVLGDFAR